MMPDDATLGETPEATPPGEMSWRPYGEGEPHLHLKAAGTFRWIPYESHPLRAVDGPYSKGMTTFTKLLAMGWISLPSTVKRG